jgi:hypothetical protein
MLQSTEPTKLETFLEQLGRIAWLKRLAQAGVALLYIVPFLVVAGVTVILAASPLISQKSLNGVVWGVLIFVLLAVLYFAEGAEIAVTRLLDRDDEQLETVTGIDMHRIRWVRKEHENFATGRQIIVVLCVIALTVTCGALAEDSKRAITTESAQHHGSLREPSWMVPIAKATFADAYVLLFPALGVLVAAQIPSKSRAQRRPIRSWLSGFTQFMIALSIVVGRLSLIGFVLRDVGPHEKEPDPSRLLLYRAQAAFRDGLGFEKVEIEVLIDPLDGSVDFRGTFDMKAYGSQPSAKIPQDDHWDAEILDPVLEILWLPRYCGSPSVIGPVFRNRAHTEVHWDLAFAAPLQKHDWCRFGVKYRTAPGTMRITPGEKDFFSYETYKFPANEICINVRLKPKGGIALREASVEVDASEEPKANIRESSRVSRNIEPLPDGYCYRMRYPLLNAQYRFSWEVGAPMR